MRQNALEVHVDKRAARWMVVRCRRVEWDDWAWLPMDNLYWIHETIDTGYVQRVN